MNLRVDNRVKSGDDTGGVNEMLKTDTIQITQELLALLSEIDEFKGAWRALGSLAPERLKALRRVSSTHEFGWHAPRTCLTVRLWCLPPGLPPSPLSL